MIAYKSDALDNVQTCRQADEALAENCITKEEEEQIRKAHDPGLYMPNIYVRAGLFLLTIVIVLFTLGLLLLIGPSTRSQRGVARIAGRVGSDQLWNARIHGEQTKAFSFRR